MPEMNPGRKAKVEPQNPERESWPTHHLPVSELLAFVKAVLVEMTRSRDIMADDRGRPRAKLRSSGEDTRCSFCQLVIDMSAIGLPQNTVLYVASYKGD